MPLTSSEMEVVTAEIMTSTDKEARDYLEEKKIKMSLRTYRKKKKDIHAKDTERLYELAKNGRENQMKRIDEFKLIKKESWKLFRKTKNETIKLRALKEVREVEPFIAAAEAAVPHIIKEVIENFGKPGDTKKQERAESSSQS